MARWSLVVIRVTRYHFGWLGFSRDFVHSFLMRFTTSETEQVNRLKVSVETGDGKLLGVSKNAKRNEMLG